MRSIRVWDPLVRVFHWGTALLFLANFTLLEGDRMAHRYVGYLLFALVLVRLLWGLIGSKYARFSAFWPRPSEIMTYLRDLATGRAATHLSHNPLGALMVYNLLATLILICITGIMMESDTFWGIAWIKQLHEILADYAFVCVGLHVAGVVIETKRSKINLVKAMVTGRKVVPE